MTEHRKSYWKGTLEEYVEFLESRQRSVVREYETTEREKVKRMRWCGHRIGDPRCHHPWRRPFVRKESGMVILDGVRQCREHGLSDMRTYRDKRGEIYTTYRCGICDNLKRKARYARAKARREDA